MVKKGDMGCHGRADAVEREQLDDLDPNEAYLELGEIPGPRIVDVSKIGNDHPGVHANRRESVSKETDASDSSSSESPGRSSVGRRLSVTSSDAPTGTGSPDAPSRTGSPTRPTAGDTPAALPSREVWAPTGPLWVYTGPLWVHTVYTAYMALCTCSSKFSLANRKLS
jgi:hypothetical protein